MKDTLEVSLEVDWQRLNFEGIEDWFVVYQT